MNNDRLRTISFSNEGFILDIPILDETHFISWRSIISKKAIVRIQIVIREGVEEYVPQEVITDKFEISFLEKKDLSVFMHTNTFSAEVSPAI